MAVVAGFVVGAVVGYVLTRAAWIFGGSLGVVSLVLLLAVLAYVALRRQQLSAMLGLAAGVGASVAVLSADDDFGTLELALAAVTGAVGAAVLALAAAFVYLAVSERRNAPRVFLISTLLSALGNASLGSGVLAIVLGARDVGLVVLLTSIAAFYVGGRLGKRAPE